MDVCLGGRRWWCVCTGSYCSAIVPQMRMSGSGVGGSGHEERVAERDEKGKEEWMPYAAGGIIISRGYEGVRHG